jgi:hypothetical protein
VLRTVEEDFVRVWDGTRVFVESELAEGLRRWREAVRGGLERSCLTGSVLATVFEPWFDDDLCSPPVVGLPILARCGGGRIDTSLIALPVKLRDLEEDDGGFREVGFTGNRLGD